MLALVLARPARSAWARVLQAKERGLLVEARLRAHARRASSRASSAAPPGPSNLRGVAARGGARDASCWGGRDAVGGKIVTGKGAAAGVEGRGGPGIRLSLRKKRGILPATQLSWPPSGGTRAGARGSGKIGDSTFAAGTEALLENKG